MSIKKVGIIGFGNFGTLLASIFSKNFEVLVYHYKNSESSREKAKIIGIELVDLNEIANCDLVILSVPISKTEEMIKKIAPIMKAGAILMDTCSVKVYPCEWLLNYAPDSIHIIGTHPMFGPTTSRFGLEKQEWKLDGLQVVLCPLRNEGMSGEGYAETCLFKIFKDLNLKVIVTTPEDHDRQNAKTLSFVHFIGRSLLASGISEQEIFTPGYADLLKILPHTTSDNWQLFYDMNNYNPYAKKLRETFWNAGLDIETKVLMNKEADSLDINREIIDLLDGRIMKLIEKRLECVKNIAIIKKERNLKVFDPAREEKIIKEKIEKFDLDKEFIKDFYSLLFKESYKIQK